MSATTRTSAGPVVVALGGNAIAQPGDTGPEAQRQAVEQAMRQVAGVIAAGRDVVLTYGNGPQVGNLLIKNELARDVVPPVPLDWCVAQTQATLAYLITTALERELAERGIARLVTPVLTRVLVAADDPAWRHPTKPIGPYVTAAQARERIARGESWEDRGERGWRRVVPSPEPREILDRRMIGHLLADGAIVVAAGGGGIPMVRSNGRLEGVEAVIDKDLSGALLADTIEAEALVIATDVEAAAVRFGTPEQEELGHVSSEELRSYADAGEFASGSMGPKVQAALRFVEHGGQRAAITSLERLAEAVEGRAGTIVEAQEVYR
jgi:carbamate kinase